jgi:hypothetical protein
MTRIEEYVEWELCNIHCGLIGKMLKSLKFIDNR